MTTETTTALRSVPKHTWRNMKHRCYNPSNTHYRYYGGRGIEVCEEWLTSFSSFKEWAESNGWAPGLEIDRINNDGNYSPDNCRFVAQRENKNNCSYTVLLSAWGETKSAGYWMDDARCVVSRDTITDRMKRGWISEAAMGTPPCPVPPSEACTKCGEGFSIENPKMKRAGSCRSCELRRRRSVYHDSKHQAS